MNRIERLFSRGGWCQRREAVSKTDHHPRDNVTRRTHHTPLGVRIHRAAYRGEAAGNAAELTPKSTEVSRPRRRTAERIEAMHRAVTVDQILTPCEFQ